MSRSLLLFACLGAALTSVTAAPPVSAPRTPNFLILLADDMGFSDAGCYGGEIATPNLDRLAQEGVRFTQAYNTARCWPTRGALLTGFYAQHIRRDTFPEEPTGAGTKGVRPAWARLLPALLKQGGYATYHSGKWHIDGTPQEGGFDRSYTLLDQDRYFSPRNHALDGEKLPPAPEEFYATTAIADRAIEFLREHAARTPKKPFFSFVAFTAPHFPLHAPREDIERYKGRYEEEADALREARLKRLWDNGMLFNAELSEPTEPARSWAALSAAERAAFATRMEVHAAMVDRMDREIGRIIAELRTAGTLENTVVLFLSDNGASAESLVRGDGNQPGAVPGSAQSYLCLEAQGANLANTPLRYSKTFVHEGGISTPLIVRWPVGIKGKGELREQPVHVVDIAPTLLRLAGVPWPKKVGELPVPPADGADISWVIRDNRPLASRPLWWAHEGNRAFRLGDWKWVSLKGKGGELYYLKGDRAEARDLAAANPERLGEMEAQWNRMSSRMREAAQEPALTSQPPAAP